MTNDAPLSLTAHMRRVLSLGLPLIGGHLAQFAIGLTDTVMLGRYGVSELAALTVASGFFFIFFLMGSGFAWAVMPLVAGFAAENDQVMIRRTTRMGLWLSILFSVLAVPVFMVSGPILIGLDQEPSVAELGQVYLRIAGWGLVPALGVMVIKSYLAALERTQIILVITLMAALANALANYILIFGNFGAPELGIAGAAIASLVTQVLSLIGVIVYAVKVLPEHDLFRRFWRPDPEVLVRVFQLGWPIGLTNLAEVGLFVMAAIMVGWLGEVPLAAHGIAIQCATATFLVHLGLSNVATVRAGNAFARRDAQGLRMGGQAALILSALMSAVTIVVFVTMPHVLVAAFLDVSEPDFDAIMGLGAQLLVLAAFFQLMDGGQVIALGLLRGIQDTRVPMVLAAVAYWGVGMPISYVLGVIMGLGAAGIWIGLIIGLTVAAALLGARFVRRLGTV